MPMFRKKPVIIEARQWDGGLTSFNDIAEWSGGKVIFADRTLKIATLEREMTALPKDWIIKGVNKKFYPCKPDIFEQTYERV